MGAGSVHGRFCRRENPVIGHRGPRLRRPPNGSCLRRSRPRPQAPGATGSASSRTRWNASISPPRRCSGSMCGATRAISVALAFACSLDTPGADTPWGTVNQGRFSARLFPATTNGLSSAELSLEAGEARTRWATDGNLQLTAHLASFESLTNLGKRRPESARRARRDRMGHGRPTCSSPCAAPRWRVRRT